MQRDFRLNAIESASYSFSNGQKLCENHSKFVKKYSAKFFLSSNQMKLGHFPENGAATVGCYD